MPIKKLDSNLFARVMVDINDHYEPESYESFTEGVLEFILKEPLIISVNEDNEIIITKYVIDVYMDSVGVPYMSGYTYSKTLGLRYAFKSDYINPSINECFEMNDILNELENADDDVLCGCYFAEEFFDSVLSTHALARAENQYIRTGDVVYAFKYGVDETPNWFWNYVNSNCAYSNEIDDKSDVSSKAPMDLLSCTIPTNEGAKKVNYGDYIVIDDNGLIGTYKHDEFEDNFTCIKSHIHEDVFD